MANEQLSSGLPHKPDHARRVRDLIRSRLLDGEFGDGRLPDEAHLMAEYRAGRNVVRAALASLQQEGMICRTQGAGTFSLTRKARHTLSDAHGFSSSVPSSYTRMGSRVLTAQEIPAPALIARRLEVSPGAPCLVVDVLTTLDGVPAIALTSYIAELPARTRVARVLNPPHWCGDWYDLLGVVDLAPRRREMVAEAVKVDELVAPLLDLAPGEPVMRFERRLELGDEATRECGYSYCRSDLMVFAMTDGVLTGGLSR